LVIHVTRDSAAPEKLEPVVPSNVGKGSMELDVEVTSTRPGGTVRLMQFGKEIWSSPVSPEMVSAQWKLQPEGESAEVVVQAEWPGADAPAALRIRGTSADGSAFERIIWGEGCVRPTPRNQRHEREQSAVKNLAEERRARSLASAGSQAAHRSS
jgi:hypothetical protein